MAMNLAPMCCCGGPGYIGYDTASLFVHPVDSFQGGSILQPIKGQPCWSTNGQYISAIGPPAHNGLSAPLPPNLGTSQLSLLAMGYNPSSGVFHYTSPYSIQFRFVNPQTGVVYPNFHDPELAGFDPAQVPAVTALRPEACIAPFNGVYGVCDFDIALSVAQSREIMNATIDPSKQWQLAQWSSASSTRLYGHTLSTPTYYFGSGKFSVWSTDLQGGDFRIEFTQTGQSLNDVPRTINVCGDDVYTGVFHDYNDSELFKNGASMGSMQSGYFAGSQLLDLGPAAKRPTSDQTLVIVNTPEVVQTLPSVARTRLAIFDDGAAFTDRELAFVYISEFGETVTCTPVSMAFDYQKQAIVVEWRPYHFLNLYISSQTFVGAHFATYITKDLVPGNILGQDGVTVYSMFGSGRRSLYQVGYGYGYQFPHVQQAWGTVISGKMPRQRTLTDGRFDLPPPPPEPEPTCEPVDGCEPVSDASISVGNMTNHLYEQQSYSGPGGAEPYRRQTTYQNLEGHFQLPNVTDLAAPCFGAISGQWLFEIALGEFSNYADPGIPIWHYQFTNTTEWKVEAYAHRLAISVTCSGGQVRIGRVLISSHIFQRFSSGSPMEFYYADCRTPQPEEFALFGIPGQCSTSDMATWFNGGIVEADLNDGFVPQNFVVAARFGAIS